MNRKILTAIAAVGCLAASAVPSQAQESSNPTKIAIIDIQQSIARTQEGQQLIKQLQEKYKPTQDRLANTSREIETLREQLNKGMNTMSDEARRKLARDIQQKERDLQREGEDARAEFDRDQQESFSEVGGRMMTVIDKYAKEKGFAVVLDISSPQSPVLYAVNEVNITNDIIERYDQAHPPGTAAAAPGEAVPGAAAPSSSPAAAAKPAQ